MYLSELPPKEFDYYNFDLSASSISGACLQKRTAPYIFRKHIHTSFELYLITSGNCLMNINGILLSCVKNDFIMILPNTVHSFEVPQNECEFLHIHFNPDIFSHILVKKTSEFSISLTDALLFHCNFYYRQVSNTLLFNLITSIVGVYQKNENFAGVSTNLHLAQLMLYILEQVSKDMPLTSNVHAQNHYIAYTLQYISEHYHTKLLISDIAEMLNISPRYLSKIFSQHMHLTLANYINIYRINQAVHLMETTNLSLVDIALAIGLKDSQHFSRLFTKIMNTSPGKYRKLIQTTKPN